MTPINPVPVHHTEGGHQFSNVFRKAGRDGEPGKLLARFYGDDHRACAEEFCEYWFELNNFSLQAPSDEVDPPNARPRVNLDESLPTVELPDIIDSRSVLTSHSDEDVDGDEPPNPVDTARSAIDLASDGGIGPDGPECEARSAEFDASRDGSIQADEVNPY